MCFFLFFYGVVVLDWDFVDGENFFVCIFWMVLCFGFI